MLDVGAGDGFLGAELLRELPELKLNCWDIFYGDDDLLELEVAHPQIVFTREAPAQSFDLILLLDVIEHVEDDAGFLSQIVAEQLAPNGLTLLTVPAWPALFSAHDRQLKHYRRYTPAAVRRLLKQCGLEPVVSGGLFHGLLGIRTVMTARERMTKRETDAVKTLGDWRGGAGLSRALAGGLMLEGRLSYMFAKLGVELPGLSYWAWCRRAK